MGMDLVPVYEEQSKGDDYGQGVVEINPAVENNMGVRTTTAELADMEKYVRTVGYVQYNEDSLVHSPSC